MRDDSVQLSMRVGRGPHWSSADQDGGKVGLGTVIGYRNARTVASGVCFAQVPPLHAVVKWDNGVKAFYKIGVQVS